MLIDINVAIFIGCLHDFFFIVKQYTRQVVVVLRRIGPRNKSLYAVPAGGIVAESCKLELRLDLRKP